MQKHKMHETHSNNMLYQPRYAPINISNLVILPDNVKTHALLTNWFNWFSWDLNDEQGKGEDHSI